MKKLISVFLGVVLVFSVCSTVLAADTTNYITGSTTTAGEGRTVTWKDTFKKSTDAKDPQNLPAVTFKYTIAPGTGAAATANSPLVLDGVGTPTINNAAHTKTDVGDLEDSVDVKADFTGVTFEKAGIYRYNVTVDIDNDSTGSEADIAVDTGNESKKKYVLDVYVKKITAADGTTNTFEPYAYALSKTGEFQSFKYDETNKKWTATYDGTDTNSGKVGEITHELTTYDLTVKKIITGDAAANEFEFTIAITNVPADVHINMKGKTDPPAGNQTFIETLQNNGEIVIQGLPSTALYEILEKVNKLEGYTVEVKVNGTADEAGYGWKDTNDKYGNKAATTMGTLNKEIVFTNKLDNISPTGVMLRVAPYVLLLIAGIALLLISRRRSVEKE